MKKFSEEILGNTFRTKQIESSIKFNKRGDLIKVNHLAYIRG